MAKLIKNGRIIADDWQVLTLAEGDEAASFTVPAGRNIVPLAVWQAQHDALAARGDVGVWLDSDQDPAELADDASRLAVIAVNFPKFSDGRGYSTATLLRTRYGFKGELRAIGDVLRDQFNYLLRCGFDALQPAAERYTDAQLEAGLASISDFTEPYQASVSPAQPLFRRAARTAAQVKA